jgi:nicotinamide-nucleotide amidase
MAEDELDRGLSRPHGEAKAADRSLFDDELFIRADRLIALYRSRGLMLATAESCTGGLVAALLTEIAGSSDVVERGFVTYSNAAKEELLGVAPALLAAHGAVSAAVACAMAQGALDHSRADIAVAITGIAGPGGGTPEKPVGLVHFATAGRTGGVIGRERRFGAAGRAAIRRASLVMALELLRERAG